MSDPAMNDFETRFEQRLQRYSAIQVRPFDADRIALSAAAHARRRFVWPTLRLSALTPLYWLLLVALLLALILAAFAAGALQTRRINLSQATPLPTPGVVAPRPLGRNGAIAFQVEGRASDPGGVSRIHLVNPDGSNDRAIAEGGGAKFSGDGSKIAFTAITSSGPLQGQPRLMIANADGSAQVQITDSWTESAVSVDGQRVLVVQDGSASAPGSAGRPWLVSTTGAFQEQLDLMPTGSDATFTGFVWSPDDNWIAYAEMRGSSDPHFRMSYRSGIYAINVNSHDVIHLSSRPGTADVGISWSPDSKAIAFTGLPDGAPVPTIAPDGSTEAEAAPQDIFVVPLDGGSESNITNSPTFDLNPRWSPDGTWIATRTFVDPDYRVAVTPMSGLSVAGPDVVGPLASDFVWSPDATQLLLVLVEAVPGTQQNPPGTLQMKGSIETIDAAALSDVPVVVASYDGEVSRADWQWLAP